jgi:hypothetical protein
VNKKALLAAITVSVLIFLLVGVQFVKLSKANFTFMPPDIAIDSPANGATYQSSDILVSLMVTPKGSFPYAPTFVNCRLDGESSINITFLQTSPLSGQWFANGTFNNVSQAWHFLTLDVHIMTFANTESTYTVYSAFNVDLSTPPPTPTPSPAQQPTVSILYPLNNSFFNVSIAGVNYQLIYETDSTLSWVGYSIGGNGYSIDGRGSGNVTVSGNSTWVHDFGTNGNHTITLYANDTSGIWATPQTVTYLVNFYPDYPPTPSPSSTLEPTTSPLPSPSVAEFPNWIVLPLLGVAVTVASFFGRRYAKKF